jgi:hypothetical protein
MASFAHLLCGAADMLCCGTGTTAALMRNCGGAWQTLLPEHLVHICEWSRASWVSSHCRMFHKFYWAIFTTDLEGGGGGGDEEETGEREEGREGEQDLSFQQLFLCPSCTRTLRSAAVF